MRRGRGAQRDGGCSAVVAEGAVGVWHSPRTRQQFEHTPSAAVHEPIRHHRLLQQQRNKQTKKREKEKKRIESAKVFQPNSRTAPV